MSDPDYNKETTHMLHIAIKIESNLSLTVLAAAINNTGRDIRNYMFEGAIMADTNGEALKQRIRARLSAHPDEKWLILSGNTIGERVDPPVRFRSI